MADIGQARHREIVGEFTIKKTLNVFTGREIFRFSDDEFSIPVPAEVLYAITNAGLTPPPPALRAYFESRKSAAYDKDNAMAEEQPVQTQTCPKCGRPVVNLASHDQQAHRTNPDEPGQVG